MDLNESLQIVKPTIRLNVGDKRSAFLSSGVMPALKKPDRYTDQQVNPDVQGESANGHDTIAAAAQMVTSGLTARSRI
ncbi:MAG TPA: hypothetical protein V6D10_08380 [Trichocoleus sp.]